MPESDLLASLQPPTLQSIMAPMDTWGQVFTGLSGAGRAQNPALLEAQGQFRQQVEMMRLQQSIQRQRMEKSRLLRDILTELPDDIPEARTVKVKGLLGLAKESGAQIPKGLEGLMLQGTVNLKDMDAVANFVARGHTPEQIHRFLPAVPMETIQSTFQLQQNDQFWAALGKKTPTQLRREAQKEDLEATKLIRETEFPEISGGSELAHLIQLTHRNLTGKSYEMGTPASQTQARKDAEVHIRERAAALVKARSAEQVVLGQYWDRAEKQMITGVTKGDLETSRTRYVPLNANQVTFLNYSERALPAMIELKKLAPKLLATQPAENLIKVLELKGQELTASNPLLARFLALVTDTNIEQARVLSGAGQLRIGILEAIKGHVGPLTRDSVTTALEKIDVGMTSLHNVGQGFKREPLLRYDQRIGPGVYKARDKRTGTIGSLELQEGEISGPQWEILEVR